MAPFAFNDFIKAAPDIPEELQAAFSAEDIASFHASLEGYRPTPLHRLDNLAASLNLSKIYVKDESYRFDLEAFKVLGASYAIYRFLKAELSGSEDPALFLDTILRDGPGGELAERYTFCTATDGNHGRAVAWTARRLYQKAVIYMPKGTVKARVENIRREGARVHVIDGDYDEAVRKIASDADKNGWQIISDTAWPGYTTIPAWIMAGYTTMFREIDEASGNGDDSGFDAVFMQSGVGSFAAAGAWYYNFHYGPGRPRIISVEPNQAACLLESIVIGKGELTTSRGSSQTIMAGLNCGTPSYLAWPVLRDGVDLFMSMGDDYAERAMRQYYYPEGDDPHIISGESGAAGLGALTALMTDREFRDARDRLELGPGSRILLFNTEGATDPDNFSRVVVS